MTRAAWIACALLASLCACADEHATPTEPSALVETVAVTRGPIEAIVSDLGRVEPDPEQVQTVLFPRSGRIERVRFATGDTVAAGAPLLRLGGVPADSIEVRRAAIEADGARRELARVRRLHGEGLADNAALAAAQTRAEAAEAALAGLGRGAATPGLELRAPSDGVILSAPPVPGTLVTGGGTALELAPRGALVARIVFASEHAARLRPGQRASLEPLFTAPGAESARGALAALRAQVDPDTQGVDGFVRIEDAPPWLAIGARVRARTVVASAGSVLRVPHDALVRRGNAVGVFIAAEGRARWREVELGIDGGDQVEARSGVDEGERVITTGRSELDDGERVRQDERAAGP